MPTRVATSPKRRPGGPSRDERRRSIAAEVEMLKDVLMDELYAERRTADRDTREFRQRREEFRRRRAESHESCERLVMALNVARKITGAHELTAEDRRLLFGEEAA